MENARIKELRESATTGRFDHAELASCLDEALDEIELLQDEALSMQLMLDRQATDQAAAWREVEQLRGMYAKVRASRGAGSK